MVCVYKVLRSLKLVEMYTYTYTNSLQTYRAKYEEGKRAYEEKMAAFMQGLGGKEEQEDYLKSLTEYRAKRRAYLKNLRLRKLGLIKVRIGCVSSVFFFFFSRYIGEGEGGISPFCTLQ